MMTIRDSEFNDFALARINEHAKKRRIECDLPPRGHADYAAYCIKVVHENQGELCTEARY